MMKRRMERFAVTLLCLAMLLSSTGIASSFAINETSESGSSTASSSEYTSSTTVSQEGGALSTTSVTTEGGKLVGTENGTGTESDPYIISDVEDFLAMQDRINITSNANKYFVLENDIDLSTVSAERFEKNSVYAGALVSVSKSLASASKNVYFILDGNGHKIKNLKVSLSNGSNFALFGYLNPASTIKNLVIENCIMNVATDADNAALFVAENEGTISSVQMNYPMITAKNVGSAALVAATNSGTISNVKVLGSQSSVGGATSNTHTISGSGIVGSVAGTNIGKITKTSVVNVGMFINSSLSNRTVFGSLVGSSSGTVSNCFVSGNVVGGKISDSVGGIAGSADKNARFINNYALVALKCGASGNGLVGSNVFSGIVTDCYWSSEISGRDFAFNDNSENDISKLMFKVVRVGENMTVSALELSASWGKASLSFATGFTKSGNGISIASNGSSASIIGVSSNTVSYLGYTMNISLPSTVGVGSETVSQQFNLPIITVASSTKGSGTTENPLSISMAEQFSLLKFAHGISVKLDKDISVNLAAFAFDGTIDGCGHIISVNGPLFTSVNGTLRNINIIAKNNISSAIFGKAVEVNSSNVSISVAEGAQFIASESDSGVMFNKISGKSAIYGCHVSADVQIVSQINSFGAIAGVISGDGTTVVGSGARATINSSSVVTADVAGVIGSVSATGVKFERCYVSGRNNVGNFAFISSFSSNDTKISSVYMSKGTQDAINFAKYGFVDKNQFIEWKFDDGEVAFFTGNGGRVTLPILPICEKSSSIENYSVSCDTAKLTAKLSLEDNKLVVDIVRVAGVVTVKGSPITITDKTSGLCTTVYVSNGLEKDGDGNYVVSSAYDLAYISENISELCKANFVMNSDVDMSVIESYAPIGGTIVSFGGRFDGRGHTVSNLCVNGTSKVGLFASLDGAEIINLAIDSAKIRATGSYTAVLAGQIVGNTKLSDIKITNSNVSSDGIYSGIIAGLVNSGNVTISNISIADSKVASKANYAGGLIGYAACNGTIADVSVINAEIGGAEFVAGVIGLADGKLTMSSASVNNTKIKGVSEISGIVDGKNGVSVNNVKIADSEIATISNASIFVAGGISSSFGGEINSAEVRNVTVNAGIAAAAIARASTAGKLNICGVKIYGSKVLSEVASSVSSGILAANNLEADVLISDCFIDSETRIVSGSVAAGIVGEMSGVTGTLSVKNVKSFAEIEVLASTGATAVGGAIGKVSARALNRVQIRNVNLLGSVSGNASIGGFVGLVKGYHEFAPSSVVISDSVCATQIKFSGKNSTAGIVLGAVENEKTLNSENVDLFINNTIISTYFGNVPSFGAATGIVSARVIDLDKPNGSAIKSSVPVLNSTNETEIAISNLPTVAGFVFDSSKGWISEADERIEVISSSENKVVLKANHPADISIVAYYVSTADSDIRVPVHFAVKSTIRTPLKGAGTSESPYLIFNAYDLESMAYYDSVGKYFALARDISFVDADFEFGGSFYNVGNGVVTIGSAESAFNGIFSGLYNGKIHSINGLKISGNTFGGLFGATDGAQISDIIINNAEIVGYNYAGILIGNARNTIIKNILINNSIVNATEFGGVAGAIVGCAENVTAEASGINNSEVAATLLKNAATVENVGGIAGLFSGSLNEITLENVNVLSASVSGGAVGAARAAEIDGVHFNGKIVGEIGGGIVGFAESPSDIGLDNCFAGGSIETEKVAAGIVAKVQDDENYSVKASDAMISDTISSIETSGGMTAAIIGEANSKTFGENVNFDVLKNVYYSSCLNRSVFGASELNSYQSTHYRAVDLSDLKCVLGGTEKSYITLNGEKTVLNDDAIIIKAGEGGYKQFNLCGVAFELENVYSIPEKAVVYDMETSSLIAKGEIDGVELVFEYANGMKLSMPVSYSALLSGSGTQSDPYRIGTTDEFALMMQNGKKSEVYFKLTNDISLSGIASAEVFNGVLDGDNHVVYDFTGKALFERIGGKVKNLGIAGFNVSSNNGVALGALAEVLNGATIENCVVIADVAAAGTVQDAGIIAGRSANGTVISNCLTSGQVTGSKLLAGGGLVGTTENTEISNSVSTAYIFAGEYAGGLVGEAEYTSIHNSVFGNMTKSVKEKSGNIAGKFASTSSVENVLFDEKSAISQTAVADGLSNGIIATSTEFLTELSFDSFAQTDGYSVPSALCGTERTDKFTTIVEFAAMTITYVNGTNVGSASDYTDIKLNAQVNLNSVSVSKNDGIVITLMNNKDFSGAENVIRRYANPVRENGVEIQYSVTDSTGTLDGKLIGVLLKSKYEDNSRSFSLFTKVGSEQRAINRATIENGKVYAELALPSGYDFKLTAKDASGKVLNVVESECDGDVVEIDNAEVVELNFEIVKTEEPWGIRIIKSVIGK